MTLPLAERKPFSPARPAAAALVAAAAVATVLSACGGGSPLDNPENVANPPGQAGQKLSFVYFQRCVNPVLKARTCASTGCHDNVSGTGGALRLLQGAAAVDPTGSPALLRTSDMYKNYYSSLGESVVGAPDQSRILNKPLVRGVLHGGGIIFASAADADARILSFWVNRPMPQGQDEFSSAANTMFVGGDPVAGACLSD